ncbi:MAG: hypothetical protein QOH72_2914 [Solirubrobacteraceae bacterium]|jgi:hypothetical protein|nr:hypothetical protein [Solirubrobacteraceae bacterium]
MTLSRQSCRRPALVFAAALVLALGLLAPPAPATPAGRPSRADILRAAHAVERYYASYGSPRPIPPPPLPAAAPSPRHAPPRPAAEPLTRGGPGWDAAVVGGALLVVLAAGLGVLAGRDSMRPRRT